MGFGTVAGCKVRVERSGSDGGNEIVYQFSENDAAKLAELIRELGVIPVPMPPGHKDAFLVKKSELDKKATPPTSPATSLVDELEMAANIKVIVQSE